MATISIKLSDGLVQEASSAGLLTPAVIEQMLRDRLRDARIEKFRATRDRLAREPIPTMTQREIEAEIAAYRGDQRRAAGS